MNKVCLQRSEGCAGSSRTPLIVGAIELSRVFRVAKRPWPGFGVAVLFLLLFGGRSQASFMESGGMVVMEAEQFVSTTSASGYDWVATTDVAGFVGTSAMVAMPNTGIIISNNVTTTSPGLRYQVQFTRTGTYKIWIRGRGDTELDNSVFVSVDNQTPQALHYGVAGSWVWASTNLVNITSAGVHDINIWMREDGTYVDRVLLTTNLAFTPTGPGPAVSPQPPVVQMASPTAGASVPAGATVSVSADATDPDGFVASVRFYVDGVSVANDTNAPFGFAWTPTSAGSYQLSAVATDNTGNATASATIAVTVTTPPTGAGTFVESGGMVVMEAEHFASSSSASAHFWVVTNNVAGFTGTAAMQALPNSGATINSSVSTTSPGLKYKVQFGRTGVYKFWVRGWATSGSDNSIYIGVDGLAPQSMSYSQSGVWNWNVGQVTITNAGVHEINVWMREDGAYVDRLLLTTNTTFTPTGSGPPETPPAAATFRWSGESHRIYIETGGTATLSDIRAALPNAPLCLIDATNHIWFLDATLMVTDGAKLKLYGTAAGGDVNELRLRSDNSTADGSCAAIDADWGTLDLKSVKVISWNQLAAAPDNEYTTYSRAFIRARSRQDGTLVQESTLNVVDSEIAYLGVHASDQYGLTWDIVGTAPDATVFGVVSNCYIHHCVLGLPTALWDDVPWTANTIASNTMYGFNPTAGNVIVSNSYGVDFRWAGVSDRIYVTGPGDATLTQIKAAVPSAPLTLVSSNNKTWYLGANLFVENGARLKLYGPAIGGDVAELRLKSDNNANDDAFVELRADFGWLDIRNTKITSWNSAVNGPDTETDTYGRAYVRARSKLDPDGKTAHESRMDVLNSEISYLGYHATEAYGLVWKVVDTTAVYLPPGSPDEHLFDLVNVYGDILNSHLHHNFFGMYSYGHYGGHWATNEVDHNIHYGFDPHDDSDYLVVEKNNIHHNGWHGFIASKRCDHGVLRNNITWSNGLDRIDPHGNGIMLHRSCNDWVVENNQSFRNPDTGIAIFATDRTLIRNNTCLSNLNAGIRISVGSESNRVDGNEFGFRQRYGVYVYEGNDPPEPDDVGANAGRCQRNTFTNNFIHDYTAEALKVSGCDSNTFVSNVFLGTGTVLRFENSTNNLFSSNIVPSDTFVRLVGITTNGITEFTRTTFAEQPRLTFQLDPESAATCSNRTATIFDSDLVNITNTVRSTGATLVLTAAQIGTGANTIYTRKLSALPNTGSAQIYITGWSVFGSRTKTWIVKGSSATMQISYQVGDLSPGTVYSIRRNSVQIATQTANSQGYVSFTSSPGSTQNVTYTVTRS